MIPEVAASEPGRAQTVLRSSVGLGLHTPAEELMERPWEGLPERVKAPYMKVRPRQQDPEYHEARGTLWEGAGTTP